MKIHRSWLSTFFLSLTIILFLMLQTNAIAETNVTIGTGGINGIYYPTGMNICSMVNGKPDYDIVCSVVATGGSVYNINSVLSGTLEFGIAQSDRNFAAWHGLDFWEATGPQIDLRSIFSIHHESVTLIVGSDSGINSINDLSGKIVNIGSEITGGRQNAIDVMDYFGIDYQTDITVTEYDLTEASVKLQNYEIDAIFMTIGHPSDAILAVTQGARQISFVPIVNIDGFLASFPYYVSSHIPIRHYPQSANTADVPTFGLKATFITSANMADSTVYAFVKETFENFNDFQKLHPAYEILTKNDMMQGLTAPIHPGAMKYIKEVVFIYPTKECPGDLDNNGVVDGTDLAGMAADFGSTGCQIP